ncbi:hypothetical protein [Demequina globuliformis]|uniref:hypothetical protein n=1 Tax=Demequina globuliformis TaxID=676202 RepID=UPI000780DE01|nr:hypothetical protein [Demequina globuliformis]
MPSLSGVANRARSAAAEARLRALRARDLPSRPNVDVTVALTSFPARIHDVWVTLESLRRQSVRARRVCLVLAEEEFPSRRLPASVTEAGVDVVWVNGNARSYKKLIPVVHAIPDSTIVTVDDDTIYPSQWLASLVAAGAQHPGAIVGNRGTEILRDEHGARAYAEWPRATTQSAHPLLKGNGGILYPRGTIGPAFADTETALRICPTADDLWFWAAAQASSVPVRMAASGRQDYSTVRRSQKHSLRQVNVEGGANDRQFAAVVRHFDIDLESVARFVPSDRS